MTQALTSQYRSALAMLRSAIEACPAELWTDSRFTNPSWRLAYHALFYTHLYLSRSENDFQPWEHSITNAHFMAAPLDESAVPNSQASMLDYLEWIDTFVPLGFAATPWDGPSGFDWITFERGQLHVYNLRHLQHHAGQLTERLRSEAGLGTDWVGRVDRA